jgi:N-formylglutamate amidohydrolase
MNNTAFRLIRPARQETSVIFSSPHSGRDYSADFLAASQLELAQLRSSEDAYVDRLFARAPHFGAPLLCAMAPRAYVDLNRAHDELDPAVIEGIARAAENPRISSGLGVIPRVVAGGRAIYRGKITKDDAQRRLDQFWHPYHHALQDLITSTHASFGEVIVIDCHSMPHEAIDSHARPHQPKPDIVLGDRFGAAASREVMEQVEQAFVAEGFRVARNSPFAGAYIAQHYGRPLQRKHVIQIEIDRGLYLDEARVEPSPRFSEIGVRLNRVVAQITQIGRRVMPLAAE